MAGCEIAQLETDESLGAPKSDLMFHWVILLLSIAALAIALVLQIRGEQVVIPFVEIPLPGVCTHKRILGMECPGCGLTRCFISMARGDFPRAWAFNPTGVFLFAVVVVQIPYRSLQIWRVRRDLPEVRVRRFANGILWLLVVGLFLQWILRSLLPLLGF